MSTTTTQGVCYLCGKTLSKGGMKAHLLKEPCPGEDLQHCMLLKVEGQYDKDYWLYLDIPFTSAMSSLDRFLRNIWLECCGHMSQFYLPGGQIIGKSQPVVSLLMGRKCYYDYDFGSTTTLVLTPMGEIFRPAQRSAVQLLARNVPPVFQCKNCGNPADWLDAESYPQEFYCEECMNQREEGVYLPVTNSPRMGECGYCGELDKYAYDPRKK